MQIDQFLRRVTWRVRRWFHQPADNDPIVTVEPRPEPKPAPPPPKPRGKRRWRWARTAAAFAVTLLVLGVAYGALIAVNSRVTLDLESAPTALAGESHLVTAAAALLVLGEDSEGASASDILFVPSGRYMRERRLRDGAAQAAARFVMLAAPARGRADQALVEARLALSDGAQSVESERIVARDALRQLNARLLRREATLDVSPTALAALMRAAADACEAEARALSELAATPTLLATPAAEARVYQARGVAYGWLMLVRAALLDAPELAQATTVEASIPVEALQQIAEKQPLLLFNGGASLPWAPAHVAEAAATFTRAAIGARALASAIERPAARP